MIIKFLNVFCLLRIDNSNFMHHLVMEILFFFFKTGHKLGSGAFGTVYFGELENGKQVAVKKLHMTNINLKNQFENEIKVLSE